MEIFQELHEKVLSILCTYLILRCVPIYFPPTNLNTKKCPQDPPEMPKSTEIHLVYLPTYLFSALIWSSW